MECMEAARALKSSFFSELAMKSSNTQVLSDDLWCLTGVGGGDDFSIDEFFDLSNEDCCANINKDGGGSFFEEEEEEKDSSSLSLSSHDAIDDTNSNSPNFSPDLAIPVDDLQELELWSHLMDDSVPEANTLACPNPNINAQTKETGFHLVSRVEPERKPGLDRAPFLPTVVPVKARSKRSRTAASRSWVAGSSPRPESSSSSSSSSSPVSTLLFPPPVQDMGMIFTFGKPPVKKQKKKPVSVGGETGSNPPVQRRCTHCHAQNTKKDMATDSKFNGVEPQSNDFKPLQSICYKRGSLQLLDQRKLPLETVYLDIKNASDGWSAIRDMVVRGAPAIAIAAALSLAVEASNLGAFQGTPNDAASFLGDKLEYLVTSRPTAVNLSDAATKLKEIISKAASTSSEAKAVFQAYVEASEIMLEDDVASNKAIGSYGASCIQSQLKDVNKVSMLTHCNTGSLATAGYGTALGVIRALHSQGILERAYCTETRPFNQGSRLTAFELVHDNIPATLIADSAAAALMNAGRVQGVVVGADRVAGNGDTANKIGTYSLALCAKHHDIPFYVAAPLTSVDLSLASGQDIVIEERSSKELLNTRGGLGEQVAASGISVWNPAFDVTPANLIAAIITEKGVVTKTGDDAFDIKGFVERLATK